MSCAYCMQLTAENTRIKPCLPYQGQPHAQKGLGIPKRMSLILMYQATHCPVLYCQHIICVLPCYLMRDRERGA